MLPSRERFVSSCAALSLTSSSLLSMAARAICLFTDQLLYALSLTTCSTRGKKKMNQSSCRIRNNAAKISN